jgi:ketosteroid isomerase-like protein
MTATTVLGLAMLVGGLAAVHAGRGADDVTSVIMDLERRLAEAWVKGDRRFIEALLAHDWTVIDPSGRLLTKQQVIEETFGTAERQIQTMSVDDIKVRVLGGVAVATGRTRATGMYQGQTASVTLRFTDVFHLRDGQWQVVASHGTLVTP